MCENKIKDERKIYLPSYLHLTQANGFDEKMDYVLNANGLMMKEDDEMVKKWASVQKLEKMDGLMKNLLVVTKVVICCYY